MNGLDDSYKRFQSQRKKRDEEREREKQQRMQIAESYQRFKADRERREYEALSRQEKYDYNARKAQEARDNYANSGEYVTFREQLKPNNGLGFRDWLDSRKKMNDLNTKAEEAQNKASAYRSMTKRQELSKLPASDIEKRMSELQTEQKTADKTRSEEIDRELADYRTVYSDVKSREEVEKLPDDVVKLLDEYNSIGYEQEGDKWNQFANAMSGQRQGFGVSTANAVAVKRKNEIASELENKGYKNYEQLAEYRKYQTEKTQAERDAEEFRKFAEEHPVASSAYTVAAAPTAAVLGMVGNAKRANDDTNFAADQYSPYYMMSKGNSQIRGTVADNMEDGRILSKKQKGYLYSTGMSAADSVVASFIPGGEALLGASVMNDTVIEMTEKGASKNQALATGIAAGAFETLNEHFSIGMLNSMKQVAPKTIMDIVKNIGKSVVTNFSEEAATEISNIIYDYLANGGISDYAMSVEEKMQSGMSEADARKEAAKEMGIRVGEAGLSGALMGGVFGAAGSAIGKANYNSAMLREGKAITENGDVESLLAGGYDLRTKEDSEYNKIYSAVQSEEESRNKILNNTENGESTQPQKYSRKQLKSIGKLSMSLFERGNSEAKNIQVKAIEQRLSELDTEDAGAKAEILFEMLSGERLSRTQMNSLKGENGKVEQKYYDVTNEWMNGKEWAINAVNEAENLIKSVRNPDIERYRNRSAQTENGANMTETVAGQALASDIDSVIRRNADKYTKGGAAAAKEMYRQGQDARIYENSFSAFYEAGRKGTSFDTMKSQDVLSNDFDARQAQKAYEMGVEAGRIGRQTKITGISEITDGDIIVKDTDGNEVSLGNIEVNSNTARVYNTAAAYGDVETANTFIRNYYPGTNFDTYRTGFETFFTEGVNNNQSFKNFIKDGKYDETLKGFSKETAKLAYDAGRKAAVKINAIESVGTESFSPSLDTNMKKAQGVYTDETLNDSTIAPIYEALSKKIGVDITRVPSIVSADGKTANAQFIPQMFKIVISENADSEFTDTIHETTHLAARYAGKKYKNVSDAVLSYAKQKSTVNYENRIAQLKKNYNTNDRSYLDEEFVAEQIGGMFSSEKGINDFVSWLQTDSGYSEKEKKTILQRIADILKDIIDAIKETIRTGHLSPIAKEAAQMQEYKASEIRQMFLEALDEAAENYKKGQASQGEVRNSYAGVSSMTADSKSLLKAESMLDRGVDAETVRKETGWFKGYDGKMRYEIDDSQMKIKRVELAGDYISGDVVSLESLLDHPTLFEAYPQLKDISVGSLPAYMMGDILGQYSRRDKAITLNQILLESGFEQELEDLRNSDEYKAYQDDIQSVKDQSKRYWEKRNGNELKKLEETEEYKKYLDDYFHSKTVEEAEDITERFYNTEIGSKYKSILKSERIDLEKEISKIDEDFYSTETGKRIKELLNKPNVYSGNSEKLKKVLIHEIQHAIQEVEGFTRGSSEQFWEQANDSMAMTEGELKQLNKAEENYDSICAQILKDYGYQVRDMVLEYLRLSKEWVYEKISNERESEIFSRQEEIENYAFENGFSDELDKAYESFVNLESIKNRINERKKRSSSVLYRITAGEIEANDTKGRVGLSSQERKDKRPDVDRTDVVFSDGFYKNPINGEVRYSLKQKADDDLRRSLGMEELQRENLNLLRQNREYERYCSELENRMIHPDTKFTVDYGKCEALSTRFRRDYRSSIDKGQLSGALASFYNWIAAQGEKLKGDALTTRARQIAVSIIEKSKNMQKEISPEAKEILREIRSTGVTLNEVQRQEAANQFGSYNNFRKAAMGYIKIMNNATPLDVRWAELAEAYPQWFDKDISDADQAVKLFEIVGSLRNTYSDDSGFDFDSAVDFLTTEILNGYYEVPKSHLLSNEYRAKLEKERQKNRAEINKIKADYKAKFEESRKQVITALQSNTTNIDEIKGGKGSIVNTQVAANIARLNMRAQRADKSLALKRIERQVKRMNNLLLKNGTKRSAIYDKDGKQTVIVNTIPEKYRNLIAQACAAFTDNTENGAGVFDTSKLSELYAEYVKIQEESSQDYDKDIPEKIDELKKLLKDRRLNQLSQDELRNITDILDHFMNLVRNETEIFVSGQQVRVKDAGTQVLNFLNSKEIKKIRTIFDKDIGQKGREFFTKELKPVYFFETVGGPLKDFYQEIRNGQDAWARNLDKAKTFLTETVQKYKAMEWLKDEKTEKYTTEKGEVIELTLGQKMTIFATAKREMKSGQESLHLMSGGVVFENQIEKGDGKSKIWKYKENDANAHQISLQDIMKISESLTEEQKEFADVMVNYLSTVMAELGNEVSMKLYGYRKFTEKYYFPFNSADSFGRQRFGEMGETLLKALGFTKATKHGAKTPLVLSDFMEVWAKHVERMCAYNALVIPLDNFQRVWNYTTPTTESSTNASVEAAFASAFGNEFKDYVVEFIKDVNGNVMSDKRDGIGGKLLSLYKKNAVLQSASVVIQQPSAIARALVLVDARYLGKTTFQKRKAAYEEMRKYAPVAIVKEIGGFDNVSGRNAVDWLLEEEKTGVKEKIAGFFKDSDYRDDVLAWGAEAADRVTWSHLWLACKAQTAAKTGLTGEALLEATGKFFSEVVDKTQVYDSVMSRSSYMRSKSPYMSMVTAFMGEPTVNANILMFSVTQAKRGYYKKAARAIGGVVACTLLNSVLKSLVTAGRDDDEDETLLEKYIAQVLSNFVYDLNPLTLLPLFRDAISLIQGYDVSRADMTSIGDVINSMRMINSEKKTAREKIESVLGSVAGLFGIPARNVIRDFNGLANTKRTVQKYGSNLITEGGLRNAIDDERFSYLRGMNVEFAKQDSRDEKMYQYWASGDSEMYNRTAEQYKSGSDVRSAIISGIKAAFTGGDITQAEAESQLQRLGFDDNEVYYQIREWKEPVEGDKTDKNAGYLNFDTATDQAETDDEESKVKYKYLNEAVRSGNTAAIQREVQDLIERGADQKDIDSQIRKAIRSYDPDVQTYADEYKSGNLTAFDSAVSSLSSKYQVSESLAAGAIRTQAAVDYSAVDGTYHTMADVSIALENDDTQTARSITNEILKIKYQENLKKGKTSKAALSDAKSSIKSSLRAKWKDKYKEANPEERQHIAMLLWSTGVYSNTRELYNTLNGWLREK